MKNKDFQVDMRKAGEYTCLGYRSAKTQKLDGVSYIGNKSGDAVMQYDRERLIAQSRSFMNDNAIYRGMITQAVRYIVGGGFTLQVHTGNDSRNKKIETLWRNFWRRPEIRGLVSGRKLEELVCQEVIVAGDTGLIKTNKGLLQHFEAEQITGRNTDDGITKDVWGTPVTYHIAPYNKNGFLDLKGKKDVAAKDFIHIANIDRPSSSRGVPAAQSSFPGIHRINDVCDAEAVAWQLLSRLAVAITRENGPEFAYQESRPDEHADPEGNDGDLTTRVSDIGYAVMFNGQQGDEIKGIERNIPGKDFTASLRTFLRLLGLPLGMPLELILLDWTQSNYSQTRAVLWQAYNQTFEHWQYLMSDFFLSPVLEWKIAEWRKAGLIPETCHCEYEWIKPTYPWIDQVKEAQAYGLRLDRSLATHALVCKSLNLDADDVLQQKEDEIRGAINRAAKIEKETGKEVDWRVFAGLNLATQPVQEKQEKPNEDDDKNE